MGSFSIWHVLILALVVFVLFGRGKISDLMGDVAKGIKSFKKGLQEDEEPPKVIGSERHPPERAAEQKEQPKDKVG